MASIEDVRQQTVADFKEELVSSLTQRLGERFTKDVAPEIGRILKTTIDKAIKQASTQEHVIEHNLNIRDSKTVLPQDQKQSIKIDSPKSNKDEQSTKGAVSPLMFSDSLKKAYKELVRDQIYIEEYKRFLKRVLPPAEKTPLAEASREISKTPPLLQQSQEETSSLSKSSLEQTKINESFVSNFLKRITGSLEPKTQKSERILIDAEKKPSSPIQQTAQPSWIGSLLAKILPPKKEPAQNEKKPQVEAPIVSSSATGQSTDDGTKSMLEAEEKPTKILFHGFTPEGFADLSNKLPEIIKRCFPKEGKPADEKEKSGDKSGPLGFLGRLLSPSLLKGALAAMAGLAGLFLILDGIRTNEWYKGLEKIVGKGLLHVSGFTKTLNKFISGLASKLIKIPARLIGNFSKSIMGLFGKEAGQVAIKTGLGASKGIIPKMLGGLLKFFKKVPLVGSLISIGFAVSRFLQGDFVGGFIDTLSGLTGLLYLTGVGAPVAWGISLGLDALNAFLDYKAGGIGEGKKGKGAMIMGWIKDLGAWIAKKMVDLPIIGPWAKAMQHFKAGEWLKGLKQIAYINPIFEFIGATFGDKETTPMTQAAGTATSSWLSGISDWIKEKVKNLPGIGYFAESIEFFKEGKYLEGLAKLPGVQSIVSVLKSAGEFVGDTASKAIDWLKGVNDWIQEKLDNVPILGGIRKAVRHFYAGEWMEGLKQLPGIGAIFTMLDTPSIDSSVDKDLPKQSPLEKLREAIVEKGKAMWKGLADWVKWLAAKVLPEEVITLLNGEKPKEEKPESGSQPQIETTSKTPLPSQQPIQQAADAIVDPKKGLIVSSPKEGAIVQLSEKDGVVAGPIKPEDKPTSIEASAAPQANKELIQVATNTRLTYKGLETLNNNILLLVKALEKTTVGGNTTIVNNTRSEASQSKVSMSQIAQQGNPDIRQVRSEFKKFAY